MKSLVILSLSVLLASLSAAFRLPSEVKDEVLFTCNVNACNQIDSIYLFEFNGVSFKKAKSAATTDWTTYQFKIPPTGPRFYYVGLGSNNMRPVILGSETKVTLKGDCPSFQGSQLSDSDMNRDYDAVKNALNQHKNELSQLLQRYQAMNAEDNVDEVNKVIAQLGKLDKRRLTLLDSLKKVNPYLSKVVALNTYLSYQNHGTGDENELEYFAKNYFKYVDWKDPDLAYNAWVYEGLKAFTQTLASTGLPEQLQQQYMDVLLAKIPAETHTYMLALGGAISGFQSKNSGNVGIYAKRYLEKYKKTEPEAAATLNQMLRQSASFIIGGEAPDFTANTPDDKPMSLKDFRGKVTLVDFWASWCGPCRRENPHVVKLYNQYRSKGFDVLGVSLDQQKERWLQAIEADGLIWHHISDLKGWQNEAAKLYGVTSIPSTVLLDREGKILARNLRGEALDLKLKELFGE